jgi:hypothetical protein
MRIDIWPIIPRKNSGNEFADLEEVVKTYSPDELLSRGKEFAKGSEYLKATIVFKELQNRGGFVEIADLYRSVIDVGVYHESRGKLDLLLANPHKFSDDELRASSIRLISKSMFNSMGDHAAKEISKEELLNLEKLIDSVLAESPEIKGGKEFEDLYLMFKEYCIDVSIAGK